MVDEFLQRFEVLLAVALLIPAIALALLAVLNREIIFWRFASAGMLCISFATALSAAAYFRLTFGLILTSNLLCVFGYYLCSKSIRQIYDFKRWKWLEEAGLLAFSTAFILVLLKSNSYEHLAATLSLCIVFFSFFWGSVAGLLWRHMKSIASAMICTLSIAYGSVAAGRAVAALHANKLIPPLSFWDPIFIMWSLATTFLFALAQFIHGYDLIQRQNAQRLQQITNYLTKERELSSKLQQANKEQQNLRKLLLHEFKRPLSALHATLQTAVTKEGLASSNKLERLRVLTQQATTYLEGISQYEDVAELFETPNWSFVHVEEIARDIATKWSVQVAVEDQLEGTVLKCDLLLVDIAIGNLLDNAKKYSKTPAGVSVRLERDNNLMRLDVQDDGPGIPKGEWQHIWQKFYKLDGETKSAMTGCGLGLHVVNQVAKVHGGNASVVSTEPSVIRLELPLVAKGDDHE